MTFNEITGKLMKKNKKQYRLFSFSICFAISMFGAFGNLLFSETITGVLMTDGSTYILSLGMYIITMLSIVVFLLYANGIYVQSQLEETGVFLSLGLRSKSVIKMRNWQLDRVFLVSGICGLLVSVPFAFCVWSFISLFLSYTENTFQPSIKGILVATVVLLSTWLFIRLKNTHMLSKLDIIKILRSSSECEVVKGQKPIGGLLGIILIPVGLVLFNVTATIYNLKNFSVIFLSISLIGVYMIAARITSIGEIIRKIYEPAYRKNMLFFNLMKQKGNQYTLAFFVSTVLIALTIFAVCFNACSFLELYYQINEEPYDYTILTGEEQKELNKTAITTIAGENGIELSGWNTVHLMLIGREHQYADDSRNEWATEFVINESEFYKLSDIQLSIPEGSYAYFQDSDNSMFQTCTEDTGIFYNPTTRKDFSLKKFELLNRENVLNQTATVDSFVILNDKTFCDIWNELDAQYKYTYYLFNGSNPQYSRAFQQKILAEIVALSGNSIVDNYNEKAIEDKLPKYMQNTRPFAGNELYAARWWDFYPYAKQTEMSVQFEAGAIYLMLVFFISVITFVSAIMIMGLKIIGTMMQDRESYSIAVNLGLKEKSLKSLIRKQISLIYFFPAICGSVTATFMINRFMEVSSVMHIFEITIMAVYLSLLLLLLQLIVFYFFQKKQVASIIRYIYESR